MSEYIVCPYCYNPMSRAYVKVVRCGDCRYYEIDGWEQGWCCHEQYYEFEMDPNGYCSRGERKDDGVSAD